MAEAASYAFRSAAPTRVTAVFTAASAEAQAALLAAWDISVFDVAAATKLLIEFGEKALTAEIQSVIALHDQVSRAEVPVREPELASGSPAALQSERHELHPFFPHESASTKRLR